MRRIAVATLALIAALAAPVRAACGATCVPPPAVVTPPPACHETAPVDHDAPETPGHCSHDHSASLRPSPRAASTDVAAVQVALPAAALVQFHPAAITAIVDLPRGSTRGSPPPRLLPLRI